MATIFITGSSSAIYAADKWVVTGMCYVTGKVAKELYKKLPPVCLM